MANFKEGGKSRTEVMTDSERMNRDPRGLSRVAFIGGGLVSIRATCEVEPDINSTAYQDQILRRAVEEDSTKLHLSEDRLKNLRGRVH